ncbi:MDR family MFS transporter [Nocardioides sp. J54]|uniref:MDR family MFS transporter n=1 Tax=Nocardioides sp. J54 TaxID=935866 RepID=UPI0004B4205F|nr:MDR family MFS transporter [Nocardioides sp. J54]
MAADRWWLRLVVTAPAAAPVTRASVGLRSERGPILASVMLSTALVAIDTTILATAVPAVVEDLGGFTQFPWLFSTYLLAQAVTTPIYGKLADVFGRKPLMLLGIGLFVLGSVLCAVAWSMTALIVFRAVQGLGAGAIQPAGITIMGDIYSVAERAVAQSYVAGVWATAAVVGPTLGGLFSEHLSWRWIFWINLPLGLVAALVLARRFHEGAAAEARKERRSLDVGGAVLLALAALLVLMGLLEGGIRWAWWSPAGVGIFAGAAVLLAAFVAVERRVPDPVLPLWVFRDRVLNSSTVGALVVGVLMLGVTSYVPVYAQRVLGAGAVVSGLAVAALAIGWPIAASSAGRFYVRWGFRPCLLAGALFGLAGTAVVASVGPDSPVWLLALGCLVLGLGLGYVASPGIVAAQSAVSWRNRGVATGTNMFARSVGSAVGVAVFGAIANGVVASRLGGGQVAGDIDLESLPVDVLDPALHAVFLAVLATSLLLVVSGLLMPKRVEPAAD